MIINLGKFGSVLLGNSIKPLSKLPSIRIQFPPNYVKSENRVCFTRIRWERGTPGIPGGGYSAKLSISLCFVPQDFWIGCFWKHKHNTLTLWLCLFPCFPIRFKLMKTYGGYFP